MALFIGGPLDGQLVDVAEDREHVEVAVKHRISNSNFHKPNKLTEVFFYKREVLECPTMDIAVFVPRNYNCSDVITALIQGYHQNAQNQQED